MPPTSFSLSMTTGFPSTRGAASDYGFDQATYMWKNKPFPIQECIQRLANTYTKILQEKGPDVLNAHLQNNTIRHLLKTYNKTDDFSWVAFMWD